MDGLKHTAYNFQSKQNLLPVWCVALQFRRIHFANGWQWQTYILHTISNLNKTCYLCDASLYSSGAFILQMDDNGKPAIFSWFAKKFSTDLSYLKSMSLHAMLLHYFSGLNIMKNGYEVTFWDWTWWKMATRWLFAIKHYKKWLGCAWWVYLCVNH